MKKLIPTICLALVGAAAATGSTFAWFSMNKTVEATGMKVKATTSGALVIGQSLTKYDGISTNFGDSSAKILSHSTHITSEDVYTAKEAEDDAKLEKPRGIIEGNGYINGLKTIGLQDDVDPVTGVVTGAKWSEAINPDASAGYAYFVDYTLFIASAGQEMTSSKLTMSMTDAMKAEVEKNWAYNVSTKTKGMADTLFAFTVDVWTKGIVTESTEEDAELTFVSTYHLDNENATISITPTGNKIPASMTTGDTVEAQGIEIVLRVYLDGEYDKQTVSMDSASGTADGKKVYFQNDSGNYSPVTVAQGESVSGKFVVGGLSPSTGKYVHTEKASTEELNLGFKFDAVNA